MLWDVIKARGFRRWGFEIRLNNSTLESQGTWKYLAKEGSDKANSSAGFTYRSGLKYLHSVGNMRDWKTTKLEFYILDLGPCFFFSPHICNVRSTLHGKLNWWWCLSELGIIFKKAKKGFMSVDVVGGWRGSSSRNGLNLNCIPVTTTIAVLFCLILPAFCQPGFLHMKSWSQCLSKVALILYSLLHYTFI